MRLSASLYFLAAFILSFVLIAGRGLVDPDHTYLTPLAGSGDCAKQIVDKTSAVMTTLGCSTTPLNLTQSDDDLSATYGDMDAGSYMKGAHLKMTGVDTRDNYIFRLWPPGMMYMETALIQLGGKAHFVMSLFVLTALAWSLSLAWCALGLRALSGSSLFPLTLLSVFATLLFRLYLFRTGIGMSESISTALFVSAVMSLCLGFSDRRWGAILAGACLLTAATFMRAQYLIITEAFLAMMVMAGLSIALRRRRSIRRIWVLGICGTAALYLSVIHVYSVWNHGQFVYDEYFYGQLFNTPRATSPEDVGGGFLDIGGGRAVCDIDPANCSVQHAKDATKIPASVFRTNALKVILLHPLAFLEYKVPYIVRFYFAEAGYASQGYYAYEYPENAFFLLSAVVAGLLCIVLWRNVISWITGTMLLAAWFGCIAPSMFLHVETRYLFIAKADSLFACLTMLALWLGTRKRQAAGLVPITDHDI